MSFDGLCADDFPAPQLLGDFYRAPDDAVRGVTILDPTLDFGSIDGSWSPQLSGPWEPLKLHGAPTVKDFEPHVHRFQHTQEGRRVPEDCFFTLMRTTKHLPQLSASKAGNLVLDFLEQEIPSSVTKVNYKKFTIKADAFHNGLGCEIKISIYQQESGCAVEFQHRAGDAIAFYGIYNKAQDYLSECASSHILQLSAACSPGTSAVSEEMSLKTSDVRDAPAKSFQEATDCLNVLLEMLQQAPHLQDEMASTITSMAEENSSQNIAAWCRPEVFEVLLAMLASDRFVAAYPAARLLVRLAVLPEARSHFLNLNLLKSVLSRFWIKETGVAVWHQLADMMHSVICEHAVQMTSEERQEAAAAIAATLNVENLDSDPRKTSVRAACVSQRLREALYMLGGNSF